VSTETPKLPLLHMFLRCGLTLAVSIFLAACGSGDAAVKIDRCTSRQPAFNNAGAGYELLNFRSGEVWATGDWTPDEFSSFHLPTSWFFWRKNGPRVGLADEAQFLRSPGCAPGEYTYLTAFNREFVQVVELGSMIELLGTRGPVRRVELEKYHVLVYRAGAKVSILENPAGEAFIAVARGLDRTSGVPSLPAGWAITEKTLGDDRTIELLGTVSVLRLENGDSYQGPISLLQVMPGLLPVDGS
jgi:hypothetical protein